MGFLDRFRPPAVSDSESVLSQPKPDLSDGIRTTAIVERVVVTGVTSRERHGRHDEITFGTFTLADEQGANVVCQRKLLIQESHIPPPGTVVPDAYLPGRIEEALDLVRGELDVPLDEFWERPDPGVPRGWSGGVSRSSHSGRRECFR
ncbi:MAG: hypothetical protein ACXVEY_13020 [Actinomycetota bacterium]